MLLQISGEIESIDEQIANLRVARACLVEDRQTRLSQQRAAQGALRDTQRQTKKTSSVPPVPAAGSIDYSQSSQFKWKQKLDGILERVFGIKSLRLCQEGVLNAVLDGRDVICIMPVCERFLLYIHAGGSGFDTFLVRVQTGGGKSVCFQAPALMSRGVTLVISPLLSLMADQVLALNAKGVEAVM
jgi:ATP-dependent DNA helicase Q1